MSLRLDGLCEFGLASSLPLAVLAGVDAWGEADEFAAPADAAAPEDAVPEGELEIEELLLAEGSGFSSRPVPGDAIIGWPGRGAARDGRLLFGSCRVVVGP